MPLRRTKILATLGPSTDPPGMIERLVAAGLDGVRINCSYDEPATWAARVVATRAAAAAAGRPIAVLADLSGPKLRLAQDVAERELVVGDPLLFSGTPHPDPQVMEVGWAALAGEVVAGESEIIIGDGSPRLMVTGIDGDLVTAVCTRPGRVLARKGVFVTRTSASAPALEDKDLRDLDAVCAMDVEFVALSFVRSAADMQQLRSELKARGSAARTVAKIEKLEACAALDEIIQVSDGVMVARGDLGVEAGVARVPMIQKDVVHRTSTAGKLTITATQMMESMIESPEPTRAEATDVANAILDGTSVVMLSAETTIGAYPEQTILAMGEVALEAEKADLFSLDIEAGTEGVAEAVMQSAVHMCEQMGAAALVIATASGGSVRAATKYRPSRPIVALAHDERVRRQLALEWGVIPASLSEGLLNLEEFVAEALETARVRANLVPGDLVVITCGRQMELPGATDLVIVRRVSE